MPNLVIERAGGYEFYTRPETLDHFVLRENFGRNQQYLSKISLRPDDVWLDFGAHIGAFSISIAKSVAQVIAYEPQPNNFKLLSRNIKRNHISNVIASQEAIVEDNTQERTLWTYPGRNTGSHSFIPMRGRTGKSVSCVNVNEVITCDRCQQDQV